MMDKEIWSANFDIFLIIVASKVATTYHFISSNFEFYVDFKTSYTPKCV